MKTLYTIPKTKQHTIYKDSLGKRVPGASTIAKMLDKPKLYNWYYECGIKGDDPNAKRDNAGDIGTIAHAMIMCHLKGWELDKSNLVPENISIAENCVLSYFEWEKGRIIEPICIEGIFVEDNLKYGGTVDLYAKLDGVPTLIDFKTGKGIFDEHEYQCAGYRNLLEVNGHPVERVIILNIPKGEGMSFQTKPFTDMSVQFDIFKHMLAIYGLKKRMGK